MSVANSTWPISLLIGRRRASVMFSPVAVGTEQPAAFDLGSNLPNRSAVRDHPADSSLLRPSVVEVEARRVGFVTSGAAVAVTFVPGDPGPLWASRSHRVRRCVGRRRQFDVDFPPGVSLPVAVRTQNRTVRYLRSDSVAGVPVIHHLRDIHPLRSSVVEVETGCGVLATPLTAQLVLFVTVEPLAQFAPPLLLAVDSVGSVLVVPPLLWFQLLPARILGDLDPIRPGLYRRPATLTARELLQVGTLFGLVPAADDARDGR